MSKNGNVYVYICIGNSDDQLSQKEWAGFVGETDATLEQHCEEWHGVWYSLPHSSWQNACWCVEIPPKEVVSLKARLSVLARRYHQRAIAWAEADYAEILADRAEHTRENENSQT